MLGVIVAAVLIMALLTVCHRFMRWVWSERNPAWELVNEAHIDAVTQRAMADLDREYEDLLRDRT